VKNPEWKWCSKDRKKSKSGNEKKEKKDRNNSSKDYLTSKTTTEVECSEQTNVRFSII